MLDLLATSSHSLILLPSLPILFRHLSCSTCTADFGVFGVENGTLCFCGSPDSYSGRGYGAYGAAAEADCNVPCSDPQAAAAGARCGGVERSSIYRILEPEQPTKGLAPQVAPIAGYKHVGCFPDQRDPRQNNAIPHFYCMSQDHTRQGLGGVALECNTEVAALPAPQCSGSIARQEECSRRPNSQGGRSAPYMTLELCDALCTGFRYFATQTGFKCYCGQSYGLFGNVSMPSLCHHPCSGNSSQLCGGDRYGPNSASTVHRRLGVSLQDVGGVAQENDTPNPNPEPRPGARATARQAPPPPTLSPSSKRRGQHGEREPPRTQTSGAVPHAALATPPYNTHRLASDTRPSCVLLPACAAPNSSVDWASIGNGTSVIVGATRDQGEQCDASWAFAAAAALESSFAIAYGKFVRGSPQSLLDCGYRFGANSCKGGDLNRAFMYAFEYGLCSEEYYRYSGATCGCPALVEPCAFGSCRMHTACTLSS